LFTTVNGASRANFAAVSSTGTGALGSMNPAPDDEVRALLLDGSKLVVGGTFTTITGDPQHRLARLDATTGALDAGFTPNVSGGGVFAITRPPGANVYAIGGGFTLIGNNPHNFIGMVNAATGAANAWTPSTVCPPGIKCQALSLDSDGTRVYAAIAGPGGQTAAYDLSSGQRIWVVASDGNAQALALYGGELFVGGHFNTSFGGRLRRTLAAVDARTGAVDPNFRPSATSTFPGTEAMLATPVGVVAGGAQLSIGATAQSRFAIFPATTVAPTAKKVGGTGLSNYAVRRTLSRMR
jgi:outer membrane protein assembly factor BamB